MNNGVCVCVCLCVIPEASFGGKWGPNVAATRPSNLLTTRLYYIYINVGVCIYYILYTQLIT